MGKRPGMHHGGTPVGRTPDRRRIQQVMAIEAVITDDVMTQVLEMSRYRGTNVTPIPRDQNPHDPMIGDGPTAAPAHFTDKKERGHSPRPPGCAPPSDPFPRIGR